MTRKRSQITPKIAAALAISLIRSISLFIFIYLSLVMGAHASPCHDDRLVPKKGDPKV